MAETWGDWGSQVVIPHVMQLAHLLGELKRGPYLLGQLLVVIYFWNLCQLLPPVRPHWGGLCSGECTGLSSGKALQCLLFHPWDLLCQQLQLQEWAWASGQPLVTDWLSLSILSSKAAADARTLQWASLTSARSLSVEVSLLLLLGVLFHDVWASAGSDSFSPLGGWPPFHLRWFFKEDTTSLTNSSVHSGPHSGDHGSLWSLYTWQYRSLISSLLVWGPTAWTAEMSTCRSRCGRPCQWPWWIICSTSFLPEWAACRNIS